jgi:hypothetical protein
MRCRKKGALDSDRLKLINLLSTNAPTGPNIKGLRGLTSVVRIVVITKPAFGDEALKPNYIKIGCKCCEGLLRI